MTYGLTASGLSVPTTDVIREGLNTFLRNTFGASINVGDTSILGQITGILAERLASLWQALEAVNSSQDPDKATGAALDAICSLTGTFRPAARYSTVTLTLTGAPTTPVVANNKSETNSTHIVFAHIEDGTIAAVSAWGAGTFALGDRVTNGGNVYQCITAGTSVSGPSGTSADSTDGGTAHWTYVGQGTGAIDVLARAESVGPVVAFARDITVKNTSVVGWDGVVNLQDANVGRDVASDGELRLLRSLELATGGSTTINALRAELLEVEGVTAATIFVNDTDVTDADGVPPHAIEALVSIPAGAANDQLVFNALGAGVAAGIKTHSSGPGAASGTFTDDEGTEHAMKFTRPTEVPIYATLAIKYDAKTFPSDGADQIKQAIAEWGGGLTTGRDAVSAAISAQAFFINGVLDVTSCLIGTAPSPVSSATIPISLREIATYDTSRIVVTTTPATP